MAATDNPLKLLVDACITDVAAWLLQSEVKSAVAMNVELPTSTLRVDQLYRVALRNGRFTKLHIEFQGLHSHKPMPWRMLDYMPRIAKVEADLDLHSVVIYVGDGAGANDTGAHQVLGPDGNPVIQWRYQVVRL
jgi:hypothetical protein